MKTRAGIALLLVGILGSSTGTVSSATAQGPAVAAACDAAIDQTFSSILEAGGISENQQMVGQGVFDAWKEYLTSPSEEKLNNTALSLTKSALAALVPGAGVTIEASEGAIGGVKATIDEAERLRMQNFICGGSDVLDLPNNNFWEFPLVRQMGLTCENFGERYISYAQLMELKALWEGEHSRRVIAFQTNSLQTRNRLGQAWYVLQQQWAARHAEAEYRRIRSELFRHAAGQSAQCTRPAQQTEVAQALRPASYANPRSKDGHFVDRCYAYASGCDDNNSTYKPSADAFCKSMGHSGVVQDARASQWSFKAPTQIQANGQLCEDPRGCGGLDYVSCQ